MKLEKIISISNKKSYYRFIAMERSLRATGCQLPLWVIPWDDDLFELPSNAFWWENQQVSNWVKKHGCMPGYKKYACLLESNYQFVDADIIFLQNPALVLTDLEGFITCCGHWHNPGQTYNAHSLQIYQAASTTWQKQRFNAGQFAASEALYTTESLMQTAEDPLFIATTLQVPYHEQNGMNLLVHLADTKFTNITLPPFQRQSSWAGDYSGDDYQKYWNKDSMPLLIHWAGCDMLASRGIDKEMLQYLSATEQQQWFEQLKVAAAHENRFAKKLRRNISVIKQAIANAPLKW